MGVGCVGDVGCLCGMCVGDVCVWDVCVWDVCVGCVCVWYNIINYYWYSKPRKLKSVSKIL